MMQCSVRLGPGPVLPGWVPETVSESAAESEPETMYERRYCHFNNGLSMGPGISIMIHSTIRPGRTGPGPGHASPAVMTAVTPGSGSPSYIETAPEDLFPCRERTYSRNFV